MSAGANGGNGGSDARGRDFVHALGEFLAEASDAESFELLDVRRLPGGAVQENYAVEADIRGGPESGRRSYVVRTDAPSGVSTSISRSQEFAVLGVAHAAGLTVPEPLWACDDRARAGREFYVMRRAPGVAAGHRLVRDAALDPVREGLVERLGAELARLHRIRPPFPGLDFLPPPDLSPALMRVFQIRAWLDALPEPRPALEWGLRWLERNAAPAHEVVLCHGDYRTGNYLVHEGELTGILDWEFASWSDPLEDLGWMCARCWRFGAWAREAGGMGSREALYRGYERESGVSLDRELIPYWEVMAAVRWAVLALQQAQRHLSGAEPSLELALTGRMVPEMELDAMLEIEAIRARTGA